MARPALEVADIFRNHGAAWRKANAGHVSLGQLKVMSAIESCRTVALGGHVMRCEDCSHTQIAYNSCRNRHCPKCQGSQALAWMEQRKAELLAAPYFHVVFTLPARIAAIAYQNKAVNRLVADALEAEWNDKLRLHADAAADYDRRSREQAATLDADMRRRILDLAEQLPQIWQDPRVDSRERKRILRLLVDDVTLVKADTITAHVRLSGGATRTLVLKRPLPIAQIRKFKPELITEVDHLLDQYCDREIADILNKRGHQTWERKPFNLKKIAFIRTAYKLPSRHQRLRRRGMLTTREVAAKLGVAPTTVHEWGRQGLIKKHYADSLNRGLWDIPSGIMIIKGHGGRDAHHAAIVPSPE
jgi:hypothetical protein